MSYSGNGYPSDDGLDISTKGSIHTSDGTGNTALAVSGNNGYVLTENSSETDGLEWVENAHSSVTADSTTTFTNKSIDLTTNTLTGSSSELATAISDETGSGALVFGTAPTITLANGTGLVATTGLTATGTKDSTTYLTGNDTWTTISAGASGTDNITVNSITKTLATWILLGL